jgi:hypothetical protein
MVTSDCNIIVNLLLRTIHKWILLSWSKYRNNFASFYDFYYWILELFRHRVPKSNNKNRKRKQNYCDIWTKTTGFIYEWFLIEDSQLCCNLMWPSIVIISEEKFEDTKEEIRSCQMKDNELAKRKWQKDKQWSTKRCKHNIIVNLLLRTIHKWILLSWSKYRNNFASFYDFYYWILELFRHRVAFFVFIV